MAHKGKATSDVDYNQEDPPSAYSNATIHSRLNEYTTMARVVHWPDYDPSIQDFDAEVVMRAEGGKKHGRYWLGDGVIDMAATPSLSPRSRQVARAQARQYDLGRTLHSTGWRHSRLFLFYSSFIDFYIP
jgi:hypothetical protein